MKQVPFITDNPTPPQSRCTKHARDGMPGIGNEKQQQSGGNPQTSLYQLVQSKAPHLGVKANPSHDQHSLIPLDISHLSQSHPGFFYNTKSFQAGDQNT